MADKVLYEPTARELLDAIEEAKKEGRKEIHIKGTYRDSTAPPIPSPHAIPWDFDPSRLRSSLSDGYTFREPDDKSEVSMEATKRVVESLKDAFPLTTDSPYREVIDFSDRKPIVDTFAPEIESRLFDVPVPKFREVPTPDGIKFEPIVDSHNVDIYKGDIVYVTLIGGNCAVYEVESISRDGRIIPLKGSFYIIKGYTAEAHDEEYYMAGVGARQVQVIESMAKIPLTLAIQERHLLEVYKAKGV